MKYRSFNQGNVSVYLYDVSFLFIFCVLALTGGVVGQGWVIPLLLVLAYSSLHQYLDEISQIVVRLERHLKDGVEPLSLTCIEKEHQDNIYSKSKLECAVPFMYFTVVILFCGAVELIGGLDRAGMVIPLLLLLTYYVVLWMVAGVEKNIRNIELKIGMHSLDSIYKTVRIIPVAYTVLICFSLVDFYVIAGIVSLLIFFTHSVLIFHGNVLVQRIDLIKEYLTKIEVPIGTPVSNE
ncbi:hypothetical protein AGMMS50225_02330 [Betaproteobacteria bacterium]|nr:hypothetical protein AGMMS50225_02330 [Betaproteobacteria bacterium]